MNTEHFHRAQQIVDAHVHANVGGLIRRLIEVDEDARETYYEDFPAPLNVSDLARAVANAIHRTELAEVLEDVGDEGSYEDDPTRKQEAGYRDRLALLLAEECPSELIDRADHEGVEVDDYRAEIYEFWAVSDFLANALSHRGETVCRNFYGLTVWGRTCTGQAIAMDTEFLDMARERLTHA